MDSLLVLCLLALGPLVLVGALLLVLRWPAQWALPVGYAAVVGVAMSVWGMDVTHVAAASVRGLIAAVGVLYLVFAAVLLITTVRASGAMLEIRSALTHLAPDRRVQAILVAWLFGSFIEGAGGYGLSALITAPLLLGLGFPAMAAAMAALTLVGTAASFGAMGTPILVGILGGLESSVAVDDHLFLLGAGLPRYVDFVAVRVALLHAAVGALTPLLAACMLTGFFGAERRFSEGLRVWKFALFASASLIVPYLAVAALLGPELPSVLGGLIGLGAVAVAAKRGLWMPTRPWDFASAPDRAVEPSADPGDEARRAEPALGLARASAPYLILAPLLLLARLPSLAPLDVLAFPAMSPVGIFGTPIAGPPRSLFLPGTAILLAALAGGVMQRVARPRIVGSWRLAAGRTGEAALVVLYALPLLHVFVNSGPDVNASGLHSMPTMLAQGAAAVAGPSWAFFAPWLGALGTLLTGDATASGETFALFQFAAAQNIGASPAVIVAAHEVGGAVGTMIALTTVISVSAVVGALGREGDLLARVLLPLALSCLLAGSLACLWVGGPGVNPGTLGLLVLLAAAGFAAVRFRSGDGGDGRDGGDGYADQGPIA